ncbi:uncharacterized protein [Montipora capricornis]|uniref:uncharacterized protein isoform X2 n=1 Tax=Montipora capricornis TaxID=246305 RepID=UPI0035F15BAC
MARFAPIKQPFYFLDSVIPYDEDKTHEFKGHRNIVVEDLPPWCYIPGTEKRSRKAVSRNINAFLNTGKGGTIYLGVVDDGKVKGLRLTKYQKDHVKVAVKDALSRYTPKVPEECYKVEFVPVVEYTETDDVELHPQQQDDMDDIFDETDSNRMRPHLLRTPHYCWCDKEAVDTFRKGCAAPLYVVEITVFSWKKQNFTREKDHAHIQLHPVYEDEEGNCYFRRQASIDKYSLQDVVDLTKQEVHQHFKPLFLSIKEEMMVMKEKFNLISCCKTSAKGYS